MLELAWEALERSGRDPAALNGEAVGVFAGITGSDYSALARRGGLERLAPQAIAGQPADTAAGRIAFALGLAGSGLALDTACSSSAMAIHLACRALAAGDCTMALAGGVNLMLSPETSVVLARAGMLSASGRCATFDAAADGFVRGEGGGLAVLKPLAAAERDGDPVLAVILSSAANHDGRASGFTVPNGSAQAAVMAAALAKANVEPADIGYVEAHGTGTALGDPIEAHALGEVFGARTTPLAVGSVENGARPL